MFDTKYTIETLFEGPRSVWPHAATQIALCSYRLTDTTPQLLLQVDITTVGTITCHTVVWRTTLPETQRIH